MLRLGHVVGKFVSSVLRRRSGVGGRRIAAVVVVVMAGMTVAPTVWGDPKWHVAQRSTSTGGSSETYYYIDNPVPNGYGGLKDGQEFKVGGQAVYFKPSSDNKKLEYYTRTGNNYTRLPSSVESTIVLPEAVTNQILIKTGISSEDYNSQRASAAGDKIAAQTNEPKPTLKGKGASILANAFFNEESKAHGNVKGVKLSHEPDESPEVLRARQTKLNKQLNELDNQTVKVKEAHKPGSGEYTNEMNRIGRQRNTLSNELGDIDKKLRNVAPSNSGDKSHSSNLKESTSSTSAVVSNRPDPNVDRKDIDRNVNVGPDLTKSERRALLPAQEEINSLFPPNNSNPKISNKDQTQKPLDTSSSKNLPQQKQIASSDASPKAALENSSGPTGRLFASAQEKNDETSTIPKGDSISVKQSGEADAESTQVSGPQITHYNGRSGGSSSNIRSNGISVKPGAEEAKVGGGGGVSPASHPGNENGFNAFKDSGSSSENAASKSDNLLGRTWNAAKSWWNGSPTNPNTKSLVEQSNNTRSIASNLKETMALRRQKIGEENPETESPRNSSKSQQTAPIKLEENKIPDAPPPPSEPIARSATTSLKENKPTVSKMSQNLLNDLNKDNRANLRKHPTTSTSETSKAPTGSSPLDAMGKRFQSSSIATTHMEKYQNIQKKAEQTGTWGGPNGDTSIQQSGILDQKTPPTDGRLRLPPLSSSNQLPTSPSEVTREQPSSTGSKTEDLTDLQNKVLQLQSTSNSALAGKLTDNPMHSEPNLVITHATTSNPVTYTGRLTENSINSEPKPTRNPEHSQLLQAQPRRGGNLPDDPHVDYEAIHKEFVSDLDARNSAKQNSATNHYPHKTPFDDPEINSDATARSPAHLHPQRGGNLPNDREVDGRLNNISNSLVEVTHATAPNPETYTGKLKLISPGDTSDLPPLVSPEGRKSFSSANEAITSPSEVIRNQPPNSQSERTSVAPNAVIDDDNWADFSKAPGGDANKLSSTPPKTAEATRTLAQSVSNLTQFHENAIEEAKRTQTSKQGELPKKLLLVKHIEQTLKLQMKLVKDLDKQIKSAELEKPINKAKIKNLQKQKDNALNQYHQSIKDYQKKAKSSQEDLKKAEESVKEKQDQLQKAQQNEDRDLNYTLRNGESHELNGNLHDTDTKISKLKSDYINLVNQKAKTDSDLRKTEKDLDQKIKQQNPQTHGNSKLAKTIEKLKNQKANLEDTLHKQSQEVEKQRLKLGGPNGNNGEINKAETERKKILEDRQKVKEIVNNKTLTSDAKKGRLRDVLRSSPGSQYSKADQDVKDAQKTLAQAQTEHDAYKPFLTKDSQAQYNKELQGKIKNENNTFSSVTTNSAQPNLSTINTQQNLPESYSGVVNGPGSPQSADEQKISESLNSLTGGMNKEQNPSASAVGGATARSGESKLASANLAPGGPSGADTSVTHPLTLPASGTKAGAETERASAPSAPLPPPHIAAEGGQEDEDNINYTPEDEMKNELKKDGISNAAGNTSASHSVEHDTSGLCGTSNVLRDKAAQECQSTIKSAENAQTASMMTMMLGSATTQAAGQSALGQTQASGSSTEAIQQAGKVSLGTGVSQMGIGAANLAMAGNLAYRAYKIHGNNADNFSNMAINENGKQFQASGGGDPATYAGRAIERFGFNQTYGDNKNGGLGAARAQLSKHGSTATSEQQEVASQAKSAMLMPLMMGMSQMVDGTMQMESGLSMMNYSTNNGNNIPPSASGTLGGASNSGGGASAGETTNPITPQAAASAAPSTLPTDNVTPLNLAPGFNPTPLPSNVANGPTPGVFEPNQNSGGGGGGMGFPMGGMTNPGSGAAQAGQQQLASKDDHGGSLYAPGGGGGSYGSGGGRGGSDSGNAGIDLNSILGKMFPQKDDADKKGTSIMDYSTNGKDAGPASVLGKDANLFENVHNEYQNQQKHQQVGG